MLGRLIRTRLTDTPDLFSSTLLDQDMFYAAFYKDLHACRSELIIESPFITSNRIAILLPEFRRLRKRGVAIVINTKHPDEHDQYFKAEAIKAIQYLKELGVRVLLTGGHHRKLVIVDRNVLYEGSLNVLSQRDSCEIMRRTKSERLANDMIRFTKLCTFLD